MLDNVYARSNCYIRHGFTFILCSSPRCYDFKDQLRGEYYNINNEILVFYHADLLNNEHALPQDQGDIQGTGLSC